VKGEGRGGVCAPVVPVLQACPPEGDSAVENSMCAQEGRLWGQAGTAWQVVAVCGGGLVIMLRQMSCSPSNMF